MPAPAGRGAAAERARLERQANEQKELEGLAIQRRMMGDFGGMGAAIDARLDQGVAKLSGERRAATDARVRSVCDRAAAMAESDGVGGDEGGERIVVSESRVSIGDVSVARRTPREPSLVPQPSFVPIRGHVALLREMLSEYDTH